MEIGEIDPEELKARGYSAVEQPIMCSTCASPRKLRSRLFPDALHIPMGEIPSRLTELDPDAEWVVVCHHGVRSAQVAMYLAQHGFRARSQSQRRDRCVVADGRSAVARY